MARVCAGLRRSKTAVVAVGIALAVVALLAVMLPSPGGNGPEDGFGMSVGGRRVLRSDPSQIRSTHIGYTGGLDRASRAAHIRHHCGEPHGSSTAYAYPDHAPVLLTNAHVMAGDGTEIVSTSILLENGRITQIAPSIAAPTGAVTYDLNGRIVSPGLVDMHSHMGVDAWPDDLGANRDENEMTFPLTNYVRAIDSLNPNDPAIDHIREGGITTAQVLPGSGNIMGGERVVVKTRGDTVADMEVMDAGRGLKMACGENPKRVYGNRGVSPSTRMGSAWRMRERFAAAKALKDAQDAFCAGTSTADAFPEDLALDSLVALLRGDAQLHMHCYRVQDLETAIRIAHEFDFNITAFHHALEAWMIPDLLLENNIGVATFSDLWGYKVEAYWASTASPQILIDAGVPTAIKSDHPVLDAGTLMFEAAKTTQYGVSDFDALSTVTSVPAKLLGLDHRIGTVAVGMDADLVVWDRCPLLIGSKPEFVFIEGELVVDNSPQVQGPSTTAGVITGALTLPVSATACGAGAGAYVVADATVHDGDAAPVAGASVVVEDGVVTCVGTGCATPVGADVYTCTGCVVTPGMIESDADVGLSDIGAEEATQDGYISSSTMNHNHARVRAVDGVQMGAKHVDALRRAGILGMVVRPQGTTLITGQSTAFVTKGLVVDDAMVAETVAVHVTLGNDAKNGGLSDSISGQVELLRDYLYKANATDETWDPLYKVMHGDMRLVARVDAVDQIAALLRLKRELGFEVTVVGGNEAHLLADTLAAEGVDVVLVPSPPNLWETRRAVDNAAAILTAAGVKVAFAIGDRDLSRDLRWAAGLAWMRGLDEVEAIKGATSYVADAYGIAETGLGRIRVGDPANFVAYDGSPLHIQPSPVLLAMGAEAICNPKQD